MCNQELRNEMRIANVRQWEVADAIGISEMTRVKWLRKELDEKKRPVSARALNSQRHPTTGQLNRPVPVHFLVFPNVVHKKVYQGRSLSISKEEFMRDRSKQKALKKLQQLEKLDMRDCTGVLDPTPYYAVLKMRQECLDILHGRGKEKKAA